MVINDKYEIRAIDELNIALIEKRIAEKGKNQGEEVEKIVGYYPNTSSALKGLAKKEIFGDGLRDLETVNAKIEMLYSWIDKSVNK